MNHNIKPADNFGLAGAVLFGGAVLAADRFKDHLFHFAGTAKKLCLYSGILAPVNAYCMIKYARQIAAGDRDEKIDASLGLLGETSSFSYNLPTFLKALKDMKLIRGYSIAFAGKLFTLSVPLQLGRLVLNVRLNNELRKCGEELGLNKSSFKKEDFDRVAAYFSDRRHERYLKRHFQLQSSALMPAIKPTKTTMEVLQNRLWSLRLSAKIRVIANITTLAASILFLTHPLSSLIYLLYLQGAVFETAALLNDLRSCRQFASGLHLPEENPLAVKVVQFAGKKLQEINQQINHLGACLHHAVTGVEDYRNKARRIGFSYTG